MTVMVVKSLPCKIENWDLFDQKVKKFEQKCNISFQGKGMEILFKVESFITVLSLL